MSLDTSINNVGEYYSSHYLTSTFSKDVKSLIAEWRRQGSNAVPRRIQQLSQLYFRAKTQALEEDMPENRWQAGDDLAAWHVHLIENLGYTQRKPLDIPVEGAKTYVPVVAKINRYNQPWLVICESIFCLPSTSLKDGMASEDPLEMMPVNGQLVDMENPLCSGNWGRLIGRVFTEENAPRWVMFLAGSLVLLLDKHTYAQGRYLSFDFDDAFGHNEKGIFDHFAAFLSAQTLCPDGESDELIHDKLEEQSHRFAHGVTENLQLAVREAIFELANEWVEDRRRRKLSFTRRMANEVLPDGSDEITAEHLKHEALIFVYRLLFCFYAEARGGELEILPITDDVYRLGYSLESLRDLEQVPLTVTTEEGIYFHDHLRILFQIIHRGFNPRLAPRKKENRPPKQSHLFPEPKRPEQMDIFDRADSNLTGYQHKTFTIRPLTATLFDPSGTPLLNNAGLSNRCLQNVIRKLSLSKDEKNKSIGRVNYAELGINQLGAIYEGLLSYKGMFAKEDLIQVKPPKGDFKDKKTTAWFVSATRLDEFRNEKEKNIVERLSDGKPRIYKQGTFILHLSGIDREQSASYYTPEVLTQCLVEEALRELLNDYTSADADKILNLKICEPAMGSGAFLNEASEQLAEHYLALKQKQIGQTIEPGRYLDELRRVKHYITTRNVYGVDLNPTAVELGALSLWLGSIHRLLVKEGENGEPDRYQSGATPWFGLRLRCGNSLIGARRAVWTDKQLRNKKHFGTNSEVPRLLKPGEPRKKNEIYHFLVFDEDMVPTHTDKLMRQFWPERCGAAKRWINKEVKTRWDQEEIAEGLRICNLVDGHWERYSNQRVAALEKSASTATVWPESSSSYEALKEGPKLEDQEKIRTELESTSGEFQRLKLLMDAWCALWFWPLNEVESLPTKKAFLSAASLLLGSDPPVKSLRPLLSSNLGFEIDGFLKATEEKIPNVHQLSDAVAWVGISHAISDDQKFHHWELVFTELLSKNRNSKGFDLLVGNPPWVDIHWNASNFFSDQDPILGVKLTKSAQICFKGKACLEVPKIRSLYRREFSSSAGISAFLKNQRNYFELFGVPPNLYKYFIVTSWRVISAVGVVGLLHPEGIFNDPKAGFFRERYYQRLRSHFQFINQLKKQMFADIGNTREYGINIAASPQESILFAAIFNLFHPKTVKSTLSDSGKDATLPPGLKTLDSQWDTRGHTSRLLKVNSRVLEIFSMVLGLDNTKGNESGPLFRCHTTELLNALEVLSQWPTRLKDIGGQLKHTEMFHEGAAQENREIIRCENPAFQPESIDDLVLVGPIFSVATPFAQSANTICKTHRSFHPTYLEDIEDTYLPLSPYRLGKNIKKKKTNLVKSCFVHVNANRVDINTERTLSSCLMPCEIWHIDSVLSVGFEDELDMLVFNGLTNSIVFDFLTKTASVTQLRYRTLSGYPFPRGIYDNAIAARVLRLNCITNYYSSLWNNWLELINNEEGWTSEDTKLNSGIELTWKGCKGKKWMRNVALRSDFARRQALLELDVLAGLSIGISIDQLIIMYRAQFPVMQQYENVDEYDANGVRIPNTERKSHGGVQFRENRKNWERKSPLTVSWEIDNGLKTVTKTFYPPFSRVDREADYERAYKVFKERYRS